MIDVAAEVEAFRQAIQAMGTAERAAQQKRYLKSRLDFFGAPTPVIRAHTREFYWAHIGLSHRDLIALVEALWASDAHELRVVALELLDQMKTIVAADDLPMVERLIRTSETWAYVDPLAVTVLGFMVQWYPTVRARLPTWGRDPDFWIRRAAMLSLLRPLRAGNGDFDLFAQLAEPLLADREFFIRKAIGWILRETAKKQPDLVRDFLARNIETVSGLTLREGTKYLPETDRAALLALAKR